MNQRERVRGLYPKGRLQPPTPVPSVVSRTTTAPDRPREDNTAQLGLARFAGTSVERLGHVPQTNAASDCPARKNRQGRPWGRRHSACTKRQVPPPADRRCSPRTRQARYGSWPRCFGPCRKNQLIGHAAAEGAVLLLLPPHTRIQSMPLLETKKPQPIPTSVTRAALIHSRSLQDRRSDPDYRGWILGPFRFDPCERKSGTTLDTIAKGRQPPSCCTGSQCL